MRHLSTAVVVVLGTVIASDVGRAQLSRTTWSDYGGGPDNARYLTLDQINKSNVKKLKVAWIHQPGNITHGLQATPIVVEGVMYYISADNNVWAIDARTPISRPRACTLAATARSSVIVGSLEILRSA